jgi:hypothetical protein
MKALIHIQKQRRIHERLELIFTMRLAGSYDKHGFQKQIDSLARQGEIEIMWED